MKKVLIALAATTAAFAVATPACAEGFRAEIHTGLDVLDADDDSETGILYGVGIGYDIAVSKKLELGIDLSADLSSAGGCENSVIVANDKACFDAKRDLAAAIRLGYKVSDKGTIYALAGYTNARFGASYTTPANVKTSESANLDGFRLGAGYQHMFGEKVYGKVEYRYSNYEGDITRHQGLVGVGIKF
ncbi:MAG TPA: outer membrane beta-barrel protein [Allosphingosinicella sp.]|jgi:outer membrane immunogenic protein